MELTALEARVIGCLLEKEITTPELYPLSLNSLTQACNQKTSREPVLSLSEAEVQDTLDELAKKRLVNTSAGFGSRVSKYQHRFCNTEFSDLQFSAAQVAIVCVLLLRGPQTPGELRTRCQRLFEFSDTQQVEQQLQSLAHAPTPIVKMLARQAGKRESRFSCLLTEAVAESASVSSDAPMENTSLDRIQALELQVQQLHDRLSQLEKLLE
ncbi:YceH family protein [Shewanella sp. NIFS-20-20]|uniref:YceH family protein n=1 Tax=Shewanella sp. NIFS-20-20 TaxID=2853806 RepID=UPI001C488ECD|nr:DUF480 domain-containing protein [Shewanella sp. NIFS-20-20]MBV7314374.1 DUF480 domain-containing protein [Shewanella sp. NIFS-20-20]